VSYATELGIAFVAWYFACLLLQVIRGREKIRQLLGSLMDDVPALVLGTLAVILGAVGIVGTLYVIASATPLERLVWVVIGCTIYLANILKSGRRG
jgi:cytochrome b561